LKAAGALLLAGALSMVLLAAGKSAPPSAGLIAYEFLSAIGVCGAMYGMVLRDMKPLWGLPDKVFFGLVFGPALAQMGLAARAPELFWAAPLCWAVLWRMARRAAAPPEDAADKFRLPIPQRAFLWVFLLLLPICAWDWRQFPALYGIWALALAILRSA